MNRPRVFIDLILLWKLYDLFVQMLSTFSASLFEINFTELSNNKSSRHYFFFLFRTEQMVIFLRIGIFNFCLLILFLKIFIYFLFFFFFFFFNENANFISDLHFLKEPSSSWNRGITERVFTFAHRGVLISVEPGPLFPRVPWNNSAANYF